jgi:hypothetical protein
MNNCGRECCRRSFRGEAPVAPGIDDEGYIGRGAADTGGRRMFISRIGEIESDPRLYDSRLAMGTAVCRGGREMLDSTLSIDDWDPKIEILTRTSRAGRTGAAYRVL